MERVPNYQVIEFFNWLSEKYPQTSIDVDQNSLEEPALRYIELGMPSSGQQILMIFQSCPIINEKSVYDQMRHFAQCGRCLHSMRERGIDFSNVELHPLLKGFVEFAEKYQLSLNIESNLLDSEGEYYHQHRDAELYHDKLYRYMEKNGKRLWEVFVHYLKEVPPETIKDYEANSSELRLKARHDASTGKPQMTSELGGRPINSQEIKNYPEDAARRLADSLDKLNRNKQTKEFLDWLQETHPKIHIPANSPVSEVRELALEFCEKQKYKNPITFAEAVVRWFSRSGEVNISQVSPVERYQTISFHAIFLFLSAGDFPYFIKTYWEDLNFLSGDYLT